MTVTSDSKCVLYGIGSSYVFEAIEIAQRTNIKIIASIDNLKTVKNPNLPNILTPEEITPELLKIPVTIPLITPSYRQLLEEEIRQLGFLKFATFIDSTAIIALSAFFGEGVHINAGSVIGANCNFGKQVLVNRSVSIGHDIIIKDYVTFGPGCIICGHCTIKSGSFIGAGSTILPKVTIGSNSVIGAGAVVTIDVPDNCIVVGNPAKIIKEGILGYNQVGV
ncbi:acetyltransferase [Geminocystis sp. GBBB08]|uniref:acetyltransferase n=1 Tax=Geminocystis sp. GBBB08 TaxID=2604140 RepID=UPI0027E22707|nr:acetyltransferase [Geminocystis sp. GBBB08]MBL1209359.1 acetyltransferase [Geminocystis sp. GBBB08]